MNKVVLDANIWISYMIADKLPVLASWADVRSIKFYSSIKVLEEIQSVVQRPKITKRYTVPTIDEIELVHATITTILEPDYIFTASPDPKDNYLFDICREAKATHFVTGEGKLLDLETVVWKSHTTILCSLRRFRELVEELS
jgi:putative PIN family toxin of toxin-antitoxin system